MDMERDPDEVYRALGFFRPSKAGGDRVEKNQRKLDGGLLCATFDVEIQKEFKNDQYPYMNLLVLMVRGIMDFYTKNNAVPAGLDFQSAMPQLTTVKTKGDVGGFKHYNPRGTVYNLHDELAQRLQLRDNEEIRSLLLHRVHVLVLVRDYMAARSLRGAPFQIAFSAECSNALLQIILHTDIYIPRAGR